MCELSVRRFQWGVALAWMPWIPTMFGLIIAFRGISNTKATGLAAVAGGLTESFVLWGAVAMLAAQVTAIVFLLKSFDRGSAMRSVVSAISICASGLSLFLMALSFWLFWYLGHH